MFYVLALYFYTLQIVKSFRDTSNHSGAELLLSDSQCLIRLQVVLRIPKTVISPVRCMHDVSLLIKRWRHINKSLNCFHLCDACMLINRWRHINKIICMLPLGWATWSFKFEVEFLEYVVFTWFLWRWYHTIPTYQTRHETSTIPFMYITGWQAYNKH